MPPIDGATVTIQVSGTSGGVKTPVNGLTRFSRRRSRGATRRSVFMRATPHITRGQRTASFTVTGLRINDDAGQTMLRDAEEDGSSIFLTVLWDGTNGFMTEVIPTELSDDADPENLTDHGFSFEAVGEPVAVGLGPIN